MRVHKSGNRLGQAEILPILVPLALGSLHSGVDQGATALVTGLRDRWKRRGDRSLLARLGEPETIAVVPLPESDPAQHPGQALFAHEIAQASLRLALRTRDAIEQGELPLVLGGDHAVSIGSVVGAALSCERLAVIWVDAHGDLNWPEVSPSGHIHGMPLGVSLGRGLPELTSVGVNPELRAEDVYLLGVRDLDPAERAWIREGELNCVSMEEVDEAGLNAVVEKTIQRIGDSGADAVHVSFDVDALDPLVMPGTGTPEPGGFTFREAAHLLRRLRASDLPIHSLDWVELNPVLDPSGGSTGAAVELLSIALGEEIV